MGHNIHNLLKNPSSKDGKGGGDVKPLWKCVFAEFIGTGLLVLIGCGSGLKLDENDEKSLVGIALCWAFTIASLAQTLGAYSCDINPAVTLACLVTGKSTILKAALYIVAQCLGSIGGIYLLTLLMPEAIIGNWGITKLAHGINPIQGFFIEVVATFLLVFTVFSATDDKRQDVKGSIPLSIGLCVGAIILCAGPLTGASLNPARSLGPSVFARHFENHWVYWFGPICGGLVGGAFVPSPFSGEGGART